jgi:hypothetical protein
MKCATETIDHFAKFEPLTKAQEIEIKQKMGH